VILLENSRKKSSKAGDRKVKTLVYKVNWDKLNNISPQGNEREVSSLTLLWKMKGMNQLKLV
jgi:hypothetical protein